MNWMNLCLYVHDNPPIKEWNEVITELHYSTCKVHSFLISFWEKKYDKIKFSYTKDIQCNVILRTKLVIYCCVFNNSLRATTVTLKWQEKLSLTILKDKSKKHCLYLSIVSHSKLIYSEKATKFCKIFTLLLIGNT